MCFKEVKCITQVMAKGKTIGNKSDNGIKEEDAKHNHVVSDNRVNLRFYDEPGWTGWMMRGPFLCAEGFIVTDCPCEHWENCDAYPNERWREVL
jgi:hypothetical protein